MKVLFRIIAAFAIVMAGLAVAGAVIRLFKTRMTKYYKVY